MPVLRIPLKWPRAPQTSKRLGHAQTVQVTVLLREMPDRGGKSQGRPAWARESSGGNKPGAGARTMVRTPWRGHQRADGQRRAILRMRSRASSPRV